MAGGGGGLDEAAAGVGSARRIEVDASERRAHTRLEGRDGMRQQAYYRIARAAQRWTRRVSRLTARDGRRGGDFGTQTRDGTACGGPRWSARVERELKGLLSVRS